jgi:Ca-activated chloride channel family protein
MSRHVCSSITILTFGIATLVVTPITPVLAGGVPTFQSATEIVNLTLSVTDGSKRYVAGLGRRDFEILEDGVPQDVMLFSHGAAPLSVAILIDGSTSMGSKLPFVRTAALDLIRSLRPEDEVEIVQFTDVPRMLQEYTADRAALTSAVERISANGRTGLYDALYVLIKDAARAAARSETPVRRAIVVLTDGEDTCSLNTDDQVLEVARRTEISVYPIQISPRTDTNPDPQGGRTRHFMTTIAEQTGGEAYFPPTPASLRSVYGRIGDELRTQYSIGYVPSNASPDRRWRRVTVLPVGHDGLQIRHKPGYFPQRQRLAAR